MLGRKTDASKFPHLKFVDKVSFGINGRKELRSRHNLDWYHLDNNDKNLSSLP